MKAAVERLREYFAFSERRACEVLRLPVSTFRYRSVRCDTDLREKLVELAQEKPPFGYRRLHILPRRDGERVNHKRLWRVYREAGLCVKRRKRKRLVGSGVKPGMVMAANQEWALGFAAGALCLSALEVRRPANACCHGRLVIFTLNHVLRGALVEAENFIVEIQAVDHQFQSVI